MIDIPADSVTFLFTDIEGSTQLWEQHPEAMKAALARHDAILRQAIESHHGHVFKTVGDAFYAAFTRAPDALSAALDAQRALQAEAQNAAEGSPVIRVRMGLHSGAVEARDNDYFGPPLNRVARLMAVGHGGQILLSSVTDELVRGHLPPGAELRDMGEWRLKDLSRLEHIYQLLAPDLPADFPALRALDAFRTNLPAQLTSFIGREKEIAAVKQRIAANRLTTLTGPGGTGKTRLSLRVASDLLDSFINGIWFVELAPLSDPALIAQTVMATLGVRDETGRALIETLTDYFRAKTALLILDNCEHLVEASAQLAEALLQACPNLRMLVSSREALGISGEETYRVPSLSLPDTRLAQSAESILQYESARLFIERAKSAAPAFTATNENATAIGQVCARLDGIPLAIELAAARVKILRVEQIAERLDDRFRLLTGGSRTALPRQQTLRALIDWSYDLLLETERSLLRRLSVFAGGWTLEGAENVCGDDQLPGFEILDLLTQLVNKSLVVVDADEGAETRYRLLETVRQYALERLAEAGEGMDVRDRHLQYFLDLAERAEPEMVGPQVVEWLHKLGAELDNIRAALEWSLDRNPEAGLRLTSALLWFWEASGYLRDGRNWLVQFLEQPEAQPDNLVRARALGVLGYLLVFGTSDQDARLIFEKSLVLCRKLGDRPGIAFGLLYLGVISFWGEDIEDGRRLAEESLAHYRELGDKPGMVRALTYLGGIMYSNDYQHARACLDEGLTICREIQYPAGMGHILRYLGWHTFRQGDYHAARLWLTESLEIHRSMGRSDVTHVIDALGELAFREGNYEEARAYLEEGLTLARESGRIIVGHWVLASLGYVALRQGHQARARSLFLEAQKNFKDISSTIGIVYTLEGLASLAVLQGQPEQAARIFAWTDATREEIEDPRPPVEQADVDRDLATIRAQFDEAAFAAVQAAGRAMTMDEAIALALKMED